MTSSRSCSACGTPANDTHRFCLQCGTRLPEVEKVAAVIEPQVVESHPEPAPQVEELTEEVPEMAAARPAGMSLAEDFFLRLAQAQLLHHQQPTVDFSDNPFLSEALAAGTLAQGFYSYPSEVKLGIIVTLFRMPKSQQELAKKAFLPMVKNRRVLTASSAGLLIMVYEAFGPARAETAQYLQSAANALDATVDQVAPIQRAFYSVAPILDALFDAAVIDDIEDAPAGLTTEAKELWSSDRLVSVVHQDTNSLGNGNYYRIIIQSYAERHIRPEPLYNSVLETFEAITADKQWSLVFCLLEGTPGSIKSAVGKTMAALN